MAAITRVFPSSICRHCLGGLRSFVPRNAQIGGLSAMPVRWLNLQEYQSKGLMEKHGLTIQRYRVADSAEEAVKMAHDLNAIEYVLKAQILAGGRGKGVFVDNGFAGGVHLTKIPEEVGKLTEKMVGFHLKTNQTPPEGVLVNKVMVAQALDIERETYLAILMDRDSGGPVIVGSPCGGMDIEEVAEKTPHLVYKVPIDIHEGITDEKAGYLAEKLDFKGDCYIQAKEQIKKLYEMFLKIDATQVEINPFGETPDGQVVNFDAKINFDDNAEFRQKEIFALDDGAETDPRELEASKYSLSYIGMDGNIACLVNGAGLAMATMDIIKLHGGTPANFLDLGGGVQVDGVFQAFNIVTKDQSVKSILVNIFGGIVDCTIVAKGITSAYREINLNLPVVVRLEGTNVEEAKKILSESGMPITTADNLDDAAKKAVASLGA